MKKTTVIFANAAAEAEWACHYKEKNQNELVKILVTSAEAQYTLQQHSLFPYDFFSNNYIRSNLYARPLAKLIIDAQKAVEIIADSLKHLSLEETPIIELLRITLETEFTSILFYFNYLEVLEKELHPNKYFVPVASKYILSGWAPQFNLLPVFAKGFLPNSKIHQFQSFPPKVRGANISAPQVINFMRDINIFFKNTAKQLLTKSQPSRNYDILFFSSGVNLLYYERLLKVLPKKIQVLIVTGPQSRAEEKKLNSAGISFTSLDSFRSRQIDGEISNALGLLKSEFEKTLDLLKKEKKLLKYFNSKVVDAMYVALEQSVEKYLYKHVRQTLTVNSCVSQICPKLIITTHDPGPSSLPFIFAAKVHHIKTLVLLHGWNDITLGVNHKSDKIILWSNYIAQWYRKKFNKSSQSLLVAGFPLLDKLYIEKKAFWLKEKRVLRLPAQIKFGLLLTMYAPNTFAQALFFEQLFKAAKDSELKIEFLIRVHSGQSVPEIRNLSKKFNIKIVLDSGLLEDFVEQCDVLLGWDTTAIFWPMIFGKPLFYTTPLWGSGITPIKEFKAAWIPKNAQDIFVQLEKLKKKPQLLDRLHTGQKLFLRQVVGFYDGQATERTKRIIERYIS